jgi:hypothetical protein
VRIDVPSIVNTTLGTNGNDFLQVAVNMPLAGTYAIYTTQWQLEQSSPTAPAAGSPTPFEYRGQQAELARVQRYYETVGMTFGTTASNPYTNVSAYKATKKAVPALAIIGTANGGTVDTGATGIGFVRQTSIATVLSDVSITADARL